MSSKMVMDVPKEHKIPTCGLEVPKEGDGGSQGVQSPQGWIEGPKEGNGGPQGWDGGPQGPQGWPGGRQEEQ